LPPALADLHVGRRAIRTNRNAFALCEKRKRNKNPQKIIPRDCCCWPDRRLQSTRSTTSADRCKTGTPVATQPYDKAQVLPPALADLHVGRRAIRTNRNAFALCEKEKRKKNSQKRIPRDCCCWPDRRLQSMRSTTSADRCETGTPVATRPYHKAHVLPPASADPHVGRCTCVCR
jgi:hypothetical protein